MTDLRRGVLVKSEDQEEELLSSVYVGGLGKKKTSVGEKIIVGGAGGVLTLWEKGVWDDQDERIVVDAGRGGGESLDTLIQVPEDVQCWGRKCVATGLGDGRIKVVAIGPNKVVAEYSHDEVDAVVSLGFEAQGRMISGGGQIVKVWQESSVEDDDEGENGASKRSRSDDSGESESEEEDSSDDEGDGGRKRRKKRKRNRGKDLTGGQPVLGFKGLD